MRRLLYDFHLLHLKLKSNEYTRFDDYGARSQLGRGDGESRLLQVRVLPQSPKWANTQMNTKDLKLILSGNKAIEFIDNDQDPSHGLRLLIIDNETNEVGELAIEVAELALEPEHILDYSYQRISEPPMPHFDECDYHIATRVGPDYDASNVPFLNGRQSGLF